MLDHCVDGLEAPAVLDLGCALRGLEAVDIGACHVGVKRRILAEGAVEAAPARFSGEVDLRGERRGYAQGAVLLRRDAAELLHELGFEGRCHSEAGGPHRDGAAVAGVKLRGGPGPVARVRGVVGRHSVPDPFDEGLDVVVPSRRVGGGRYAGHQHRAEVVLLEEFLLSGGDVRPVDGLVAAVEHHTRYLLDRELRCQVLGADEGILAPVFINVHLTVAVEVLEGVASLCKDLHTG